MLTSSVHCTSKWEISRRLRFITRARCLSGGGNSRRPYSREDLCIACENLSRTKQAGRSCAVTSPGTGAPPACLGSSAEETIETVEEVAEAEMELKNARSALGYAQQAISYREALGKQAQSIEIGSFDGRLYAATQTV